ncbi:hypothetical protein TrVE_jg13268 [Triparma verrucosa]|uniref:Peptidase C1A papain C-terminal domain-containing protein n=1 Tax=Triparma verrucosa TaxID=1606542 RepID=A0A9W7ESF9_9STRA|nr:hypothetical protein TrVE_jg13268 [Triparma verrucosa]
MTSIVSTALLLWAAALPTLSLAAVHRRGYVRSENNSTLGGTIPLVTITLDDIKNAPSSIDWSAGGNLAITDVKDQGNCGSCWAFSTIETVESALYLAGTFDSPTALSTEELVDCVRGSGCRGGDITTGVDYLVKKGVVLAESYPDTSSNSRPAKKSSCQVKDKEIAAKISGRKFAVPECRAGDCSKQDEEALAAALAKYGPIAICINSGYDQGGDWDEYVGGVLKGTCRAKADDVDHCVQLVGYDKNAATPYWKIRNSWGKDWGEDGFIRIPYGDGNKCCVACEAVIVEV